MRTAIIHAKRNRERPVLTQPLSTPDESGVESKRTVRLAEPYSRDRGPLLPTRLALHEILRVIRGHCSCYGRLKSQRLQAFPPRAIHFALQFSDIPRTFAYLRDRNSTSGENHQRIVDIGAQSRDR